MARYEAHSINEDITVHWTTKDGKFPIRIVDEETRQEVCLTMRDALRLAEAITKFAQEHVDD